MLSRMKERTLADLGTVTDIDAFNYVTNGALSAISVTVVRAGKVRRAKLYYLRGRTGKAAKIKEKK